MHDHTILHVAFIAYVDVLSFIAPHRCGRRDIHALADRHGSNHRPLRMNSGMMTNDGGGNLRRERRLDVRGNPSDEQETGKDEVQT
jgi:hypothetical protein